MPIGIKQGLYRSAQRGVVMPVSIKWGGLVPIGIEGGGLCQSVRYKRPLSPGAPRGG